MEIAQIIQSQLFISKKTKTQILSLILCKIDSQIEPLNSGHKLKVLISGRRRPLSAWGHSMIRQIPNPNTLRHKSNIYQRVRLGSTSFPIRLTFSKLTTWPTMPQRARTERAIWGSVGGGT